MEDKTINRLNVDSLPNADVCTKYCNVCMNVVKVFHVEIFKNLQAIIKLKNLSNCNQPFDPYGLRLFL